MDLKKRLIFSNAAIIVIPLGITFVASFIFMFVLARIHDVDLSYNNVKKLTQIQYEFFKAEGGLLKNSPEIILEKDFQQYITTRLESIEADIVVLKGQERVFETRKLSIIELERCLEKTGDNLFRNIVEIQGKSHMVKVIPVIFKSGEDGKILLLVPAVNDWMTTEKLFIFSGVVFVLSFIITNIVIITAFSKKVITPLGKLQAAAGKISEGNLDFEIIEDGDTQIRELCRSFEKMRLKLVEANYTQKKYDESRKMLFSSISHDLKTPITSIKGYVEGILDGVANTPQKVEKYLRTVHSKAVHMDRMIDDLLLYSRLDMHKVSFNFEKTDVLKYFEDCMYEIDIELEKSNIKVELHNNLRGKRYIMIDRDQVRRVVINIIDNSRKYMDKEQGKIDIFLREATSNVVIEIKDNGAGISESDLSYIFDRFYRADSARDTRKGSGLGLAIAKQIIEGHGGKIWAVSRMGEGTSVMISLKKYEG
ncbi:signal transduction histidine kinase [Acetivibrio thermocellus AD2]|jgi:signal transduction histidine kinase|uniref:histidine kinase n=1 Tax=Acetivibrio thermocellus AD2 TaxID=1138384 RepID=A0AB36TE83_ACETH|nr:HAMP domain-containing sensor histidine kinase [Acetivibrio thermocellus]ADU73698.1 integral membrane sensor signal transduction histidine kinase [Acetivibrio thermocellus DSM 1313]ALX07628.1 integral membrane sensor signal transduction histidine kinase [Acetivibrio thermocellus AD2]ANV75370.1 integral membrane sensor signal transduction histidine kinase [Acetivibrio thermocellus DSM 2360]EIC03344.1 ATP-binding region ATPase domain protein [Acetivibrio thermocellus YS]PFH01896.1 signal tran